MGALTEQQLAQFAAGQLAEVEALLAGHHGEPLCACGRPAPCPHAETLRHRRAHWRTQLALAERTIVLPVIATARVPMPARRRAHRPRWWRWRRRS